MTRHTSAVRVRLRTGAIILTPAPDRRSPMMAEARRRLRRKSDRNRLMLAAGVGALWAIRQLRWQSYVLWDKTVLITGGSRGLGLALAREAGAQGARVVIC